MLEYIISDNFLDYLNQTYIQIKHQEKKYKWNLLYEREFDIRIITSRLEELEGV